MFRVAAVTLALAFSVGATHAMAQGSAAATLPEQRDGRFSMTPSGDGFLRLDTRTGAVSICRPSQAGVECRAGADERAALQAEIDRLSKENEDLRRKMATGRDGSTGDRLRNALPSDEDFNKVLTWMEQFMRRMMRVLRDDPAADKI